MKHILSLASFVILSISQPAAPDQQDRQGKPEKPEKPAKPPESDRSRLEKKFRETLSNATLVGRWRLVENGKLGEERDDKYTLGSVSKLAGDLWVIQARVQYGDKDVSLPVPVKIKWAGDTPVLSVTDAGLPGLGKYTARILFYNDLYTGTWHGPGHGGFMSGRIVKKAD